MKTRTLLALGLVAVALLASAVTLYSKRSTTFAASAPEALYPDLISRVGEITLIHVVGPKGEFHIDLNDSVWRLREKDGYPVRTERIRTAVLSLSDLKVIEPKTQKPENYALIGVQDPAEGEPSILVEMKNQKGDNVVSIILGATERSAAQGVSRRFVRLTDDPRAYFIEGVAAVETDPFRWLDKEVLRVTRAWTHDLTITHPDGEVVRVQRPNIDAKDFIFDALPQGAMLKDTRDVNLIGNSMIYIGMEDVASADSAPADQITPGPVAVVHTFDGFIMTAHLFDFQGKTWATFEASIGDSIEQTALDVDEDATPSASAPELRSRDEVQAEVEKDNAKLHGWRFEMTESKTDLLSKRLSDLVAPPADSNSGDSPAAPAGPPAG